MSTLNTAVNFTVIFGGSQYPSLLNISANGSIAAAGIEQTGLYSHYSGAAATSFGSIHDSGGGLSGRVPRHPQRIDVQRLADGRSLLKEPLLLAGTP